MRSPSTVARSIAERSGLIRIARIHRDAADFAEAVEENRMLDVALAERVEQLERTVGEIAHKRFTASPSSSTIP
jgi:hypothetical protein